MLHWVRGSREAENSHIITLQVQKKQKKTQGGIGTGWGRLQRNVGVTAR